VDLFNHIWPREHQHIIVALELVTMLLVPADDADFKPAENCIFRLSN
jgi:hypothetical protein